MRNKATLNMGYPLSGYPIQKLLRSIGTLIFVCIAHFCVFAAPPSELKGKVVGADNTPLAGVSVMVTNSKVGTFTDMNGMFSFKLPATAKSVEFSLVGYSTYKVTIAEKAEINVTLQVNTRALEDVTVTGYTSYSRAKSASAATTVTAEKINQVPMTVDQVLQGRVPGLMVASASGQPGQNARVVLRGVNTINGNTNVLYVLDGIPIEYGYLQNINPSDIETVTVLKDASSIALYGSRGSNGVIVITTKKGKSGKVVFNYNSQYGVANQTTPTFKMMNASEHLLFEEEIGQETGAAAPGWTYSKKNPVYATKSPAEQQRYDFILDSLRSINTDWRKFFFQNGTFMDQQISASGGSDNVRFYSSLAYNKQEGIAVRSNMDRMTLKNNLDFSANKFTANVNLTLGYSSSSFIEAEGGSSGNNPLSAVYYALPYEYPFYPNDTLVTSFNRGRFPVLDSREGSNAYERLLHTTNLSNQIKGVLSTSLAYTIAKGLVAKTRAGIDFRQSMDEAYVDPDTYSGTRVSTGNKGSFNEASRRNFNFISTSGLTYNKTIASDHELEVSALFEYTKTDYKSFGYTGYGIEGRLPSTPAGITVGSATIPALSGSRSSRAIASYIGLGRYTYKNKYTLNASYRYDGASTMPLVNRWHGFYSVGASWDVLKESFMENVKAVSVLRLRGSYGTTASPIAADFGYVPTFATTSYGGLQGLRPSAPGNADFDWEYTKETNIGIDLQLYKSRVRLTADVYNKITSNLFFPRPLSITSGFSSLNINGGSVRNRGVEADLQVDVVRTKDLTWTLGGNYAYNQNRVMDLAGEKSFENGYTQIVQVGMPLGTHLAPKWAGVDPATGNPLYYNVDGTTTSTYNAATQSVTEFGSLNPAVTGSFNTSVSWKGLSVSALLVFVDQVNRYNNEDYYNENPAFKSSNQSIRMLYNRWKKPGDIALLQRIGAVRSFSSRDIYDASYKRLRNVTVTYNLPATVLSKIKSIKAIRIFAMGENLYTWTNWRGFDPENGNDYNKFSYPSPRTFTAGLNVTF